jgi:hypothetical protein
MHKMSVVAAVENAEVVVAIEAGRVVADPRVVDSEVDLPVVAFLAVVFAVVLAVLAVSRQRICSVVLTRTVTA